MLTGAAGSVLTGAVGSAPAGGRNSRQRSGEHQRRENQVSHTGTIGAARSRRYARRQPASRNRLGVAAPAAELSPTAANNSSAAVDRGLDIGA